MNKDKEKLISKCCGAETISDGQCHCGFGEPFDQKNGCRCLEYITCSKCHNPCEIEQEKPSDKGFIGICPEHKQDYRKCDECMPSEWEDGFEKFDEQFFDLHIRVCRIVDIDENKTQESCNDYKEELKKDIKDFIRTEKQKSFEAGKLAEREMKKG